MGPSVLFDKSAIQSLGQKALHEVSLYFYTVVPPVLLMETLADLSLDKGTAEERRQWVAEIANKVFPIDSKANAHFQPMCRHNLLGEYIPMRRVPAISGGKTVVAKDGSKGVFIDIQPENEAVLRWRSGKFSEDDLRFAVQWREGAQGSNLDGLNRALPKLLVKFHSVAQLSEFVDLMLAQPDYQEPLLNWFLELLRFDADTADQVRLRWKWAVERNIASFAPYAHHCLRVQLLFYIGMMQGLFGTRSSNIVDLEYLFYTPFAFVFCSGDKLHRKLAPLVLREDQTFVERGDLQAALNQVADARATDPNAEPEDSSLIRELWSKHWKKPPPKAQRRAISEEESKRIMESVRPIMEAIQEQERNVGPRFPV